MKKYISFFKIRFLTGLQYKAAAIGGISTQFFWGVMCLLMYSAFYQNSSNEFPVKFPEIVNYIWLQQSLLAMINLYSYDEEICSSITSGNVTYEFCRPCDLYAMWFTKIMSQRLARVVLRCFPILIFAFIVPSPYKFTLPPNAFCAVMFIISLSLGFLVLISFSMVLYISVFFTMSSSGIRYLSASVLDFLSGGIIPLPFLPESLQKLLNILPFASVSSTPFWIYSGYISGRDAVNAVLLQIFWFMILTFFGRTLMKKALLKVCVQGG